jgi:uncharacterized protein (TIGR03067 family)
MKIREVAMRRSAVAAVVFASVFGICRAGEPKPDLAGDYTAIALTRDGKDEPAEVVKSITVKIAACEMTFSVKNKAFPAKIKLDSTAKPAAIDIAPSDGPEKGRTFLGIYRFEKGELQIAFAERGERPNEFKGEDGVLLVRLKKEEKK